MPNDDPMTIDDFGNPSKASSGARWELYTDQVMGGVSGGTIDWELVAGRAALHMRGSVLLDNNGGFVQASLDLKADGGSINVSDFAGVECTVIGNSEWYNVHLRTTDTRRPWQSYRHSFEASEIWQTVQLPFSEFIPHRIDVPLDLSCLRRISLVHGRHHFVPLAREGVCATIVLPHHARRRRCPGHRSHPLLPAIRRKRRCRAPRLGPRARRARLQAIARARARSTACSLETSPRSR